MIVGVLGGGQLARMLALAGIPLGCRFVFYDPAEDCCAAELGTHIQSGFDDKQQLKAFASMVDVVTYEFENIPVEAASFIAQHCRVYPEPNALEVSQDRWREKQLFQNLGIPTVQFFDIQSYDDLTEAADQLSYPFVIKSRTGGYDGKGQYVVHSASELADIWSNLAGRPAIAEAWVHFSREISIVAARNRDGHIVYYDISENHHEQGILKLTRNCPDDPAQQQAKEYVRDLMEELDYTGVIALEFFQIGNELLANEFAPRVHNSGHWTIEGTTTSQFENHIRAILNLPLGKTTHLAHCAMINLIGTLPDTNKILTINQAHLHRYGKQPKPGRKLGHLTLKSSCVDILETLTQQALSQLTLSVQEC